MSKRKLKKLLMQADLVEVIIMTTSLSQQPIAAIGKTEQLLHTIRKTPLFCQLIPQEAGVGLPIPVRKNKQVYAIIPCFEFTATKEQGKTLIFPPLATITVNWANQVPVEYIDLRFRNPAPELQWQGQIGTFPHDAIAGMTKREYLEQRSQLLIMYDEMFINLENDGKFSDEWNLKFRQLFSTLIEPSLISYYRVLGNQFIA
jgi:hypothetical protein